MTRRNNQVKKDTVSLAILFVIVGLLVLLMLPGCTGPVEGERRYVCFFDETGRAYLIRIRIPSGTAAGGPLRVPVLDRKPIRDADKIGDRHGVH
ncbi:MAG TPA: hypothetical protein VMY69_08490 [Phycisphaerae bacterium]|nr:hypothetical protein [Phycisphaerae bacterium]